MTQLAPRKAQRHSRPRCGCCGAATRLIGIESHPTIDRTELRTYACVQCDQLQTENVTLLASKSRLLSGGA